MRSYAILRSRSTSSLTIKVKFQYSRTQVQRTHESAGCVLEIEAASKADLRESTQRLDFGVWVSTNIISLYHLGHWTCFMVDETDIQCGISTAETGASPAVPASPSSPMVLEALTASSVLL